MPLIARPRRGWAKPRGIVLPLLLLVVVFLFAARPSAADVVYLYDSLGRLVRLIDQNGQAGTYVYDGVGNLLQVLRQSGVPQDQTSLSSVDPPAAAQGGQVILTFTGTNLAGASLLDLPWWLRIISIVFSVSGNQDVLTITLAVDPEVPLGTQSLTLVSALGQTALPFSLAIVRPPPRVDRVIPPLASAGSLIQIEGAAFDDTAPGLTQATVNGVPLQVVSVTGDSLVALVPLGVTTGPVRVTTPQGSGESSGPLTVMAVTHPQLMQVTATLQNPFRAPDQMAVSSDGRRAYVLKRGKDAYGRNRGDNTITVVDTTQHAVLGLVPVGVGPASLAVTPAGDRLLVVNGPLFTSLTVIDTATLGVLATVPLAGNPADVVASPDGRLAYVALVGPPSSVAVVDLATFTMAAQIPSAQAQHLALAPDGQTLYAIGSTVSVIDTAARQVLRTITTSISVSSFAVNHQAHRLYVTGSLGVSIATTLVDLEAGTVLQTRPYVGNALALSPDGTRLYVHSSLALLSVLDPLTLATLATVALGPPRTLGISLPFVRQRVLVSPDGSRLWAANSEDNSLSVVDLQTLSVLATLPVGLTPKSLGLVGGGTALYVLNNGGNTVSVLDTATNHLVTTALERFGLNQPMGIVAPAGGSVPYVVNGFAPTTVAFDPATGAGLATLPLGDSREPLNVQANLSRSEVYVGTASPPGVSVLDLQTRTLKRLLPLAQPPSVFALSLDERRLYVATEPGTRLTTFDTQTGAVVGQVVLDPTVVTYQIALNPQGTRLYVLHPGVVRVIDTATLSQVGTIAVANTPTRLTLDRTGWRLYASNWASVSVIDPSANQVVASIAIPAASNRLSNMVFSLDGSKAYAGITGSGRVAVIDTATSTVRTTLSVFGRVRAIAMSPDGQRVFATMEFTGTVAVINTATDQVIGAITVPSDVALSFGGEVPINVTFSPDGARAWVVNSSHDSLSVIE